MKAVSGSCRQRFLSFTNIYKTMSVGGIEINGNEHEKKECDGTRWRCFHQNIAILPYMDITKIIELSKCRKSRQKSSMFLSRSSFCLEPIGLNPSPLVPNWGEGAGNILNIPNSGSRHGRKIVRKKVCPLNCNEKTKIYNRFQNVNCQNKKLFAFHLRLYNLLYSEQFFR